MTNHYAVQYEESNNDKTSATGHAFTSKSARNEFVDAGNRTFPMTAEQADAFCRRRMECSAVEAVRRGYI